MLNNIQKKIIRFKKFKSVTAFRNSKLNGFFEIQNLTVFEI